YQRRHHRRLGRALPPPPPPPPRHSRTQQQRALMLRHLGLPTSFYRADIRCPVCGKTVPSDDTEFHLVMCLTKPKIDYNEDVLSEDKEAECIDDWFKRSRTCPQHPDDT
uniref:RING-type E3 ubiquitin transferase n=1 Tax=Macrostomum lignano TaxID=282301 RepID=A0A1I8IEX1_9PLAT